MTDDATPAKTFKQGMRAKDAGLHQADNPYDPQTPEHAEWEAGRSATYDLDEDDDPASNRNQPTDDLPGGTPFNEA